jgi:hypothetical protein
MNDLGEYAQIFDGIPTWRGHGAACLYGRLLRNPDRDEFSPEHRRAERAAIVISADLDDAAASRAYSSLPKLGEYLFET